MKQEVRFEVVGRETAAKVVGGLFYGLPGSMLVTIAQAVRDMQTLKNRLEYYQ